MFVKVKAMIRLFQFHKGTIKTNLKERIETLDENFNSIKVRLKPNSPQPTRHPSSISIP